LNDISDPRQPKNDPVLRGLDPWIFRLDRAGWEPPETNSEVGRGGAWMKFR
jgi:hypothetical protein